MQTFAELLPQASELVEKSLCVSQEDRVAHSDVRAMSTVNGTFLHLFQFRVVDNRPNDENVEHDHDGRIPSMGNVMEKRWPLAKRC